MKFSIKQVEDILKASNKLDSRTIADIREWFEESFKIRICSDTSLMSYGVKVTVYEWTFDSKKAWLRHGHIQTYESLKRAEVEGIKIALQILKERPKMNVVIVTTHQGYWGKGKTLKEACENAKVNCASKAMVYIILGVEADAYDECGVTQDGAISRPEKSEVISIQGADSPLSEVFPFVKHAKEMLEEIASEYVKENRVPTEDAHWFNRSEKIVELAGL